jgi:hypothetical protein
MTSVVVETRMPRLRDGDGRRRQPAYSEHDAVFRARAAAVKGIFSGLIKGERIWRWQETRAAASHLST